MKRKRSTISSQEIFNQVGKQIISVAVIQCEGKMYCGTRMDFFSGFFIGPVACPRGLVIYLGLLAHCLVSKKVTVKHSSCLLVI